MKKVKVYFFQKYQISSDKNVRSKRRATIQAITKVKGKAIIETALEIDVTELDE